MKRFKKHFVLASAFIVGLVIAGTIMEPHQVFAAITSTFVQFVPTVPFGVTASNGAGGNPTITVPTGKHLIIETLSVQGDVTPSGSRVEGFVNFDTYAATQAVRLYADPGTTVTFSFFLTPPGGSTGTLFLTVSGYFF